MGQLTCNSTAATPGLNATTGTGAPTADIIDVSQTSSGYGINVTSSAPTCPGINISQTGGASGIHSDASTAGGFGVKATNSTGSGTALLAQNTCASGASTGNAIHALCAQSGGSAVWAQNTNGGNGVTAQNTSGGTALAASTTDTSNACVTMSNGATTGAGATGATITTASASGVAVVAENTSTSGSGSAPTGVYGSSASSVGYGVFAYNGASSGSGTGSYGYGWKYSVYGDGPGSASGYAVYANGNALVTGNLTVNGTISSGTKTFRIDHPLDPANRFLVHSCVESPDRKNVYDGVAHADDRGEAVVKLPSYFEALNSDFRYQLTPIGGAAPDLHVKSEVEKGQFVIAGAKPRQRISWQVTGIRHDALAKHDPMIVEKDKSTEERGLYLHPEAHGQPKEKGIGHADEAEVRKHVVAVKRHAEDRAKRRHGAP